MMKRLKRQLTRKPLSARHMPAMYNRWLHEAVNLHTPPVYTATEQFALSSITSHSELQHGKNPSPVTSHSTPLHSKHSKTDDVAQKTTSYNLWCASGVCDRRSSTAVVRSPPRPNLPRSLRSFPTYSADRSYVSRSLKNFNEIWYEPFYNVSNT